jgi:hypothetical protein
MFYPFLSLFYLQQALRQTLKSALVDQKPLL